MPIQPGRDRDVRRRSALPEPPCRGCSQSLPLRGLAKSPRFTHSAIPDNWTGTKGVSPPRQSAPRARGTPPGATVQRLWRAEPPSSRGWPPRKSRRGERWWPVTACVSAGAQATGARQREDVEDRDAHEQEVVRQGNKRSPLVVGKRFCPRGAGCRAPVRGRHEASAALR